MNRETIIFNGIKFHRYPDSPRRHLRVYYWAHTKWKESPVSLHTAIWEYYNGPIPDGFVIHHKDEKPLNNELDNLICISKSVHAREHGAGRQPGQSDHLATIRPLAAIWHASAEGYAWHQQHGQHVMANRPYVQRACKQCQAVFQTKQPIAQFCSSTCANSYRTIHRTGRPKLWCQACGTEFIASKHGQKFCSHACYIQNRYGSTEGR